MNVPFMSRSTTSNWSRNRTMLRNPVFQPACAPSRRRRREPHGKRDGSQGSQSKPSVRIPPGSELAAFGADGPIPTQADPGTPGPGRGPDVRQSDEGRSDSRVVEPPATLHKGTPRSVPAACRNPETAEAAGGLDNPRSVSEAPPGPGGSPATGLRVLAGRGTWDGLTRVAWLGGGATGDCAVRRAGSGPASAPAQPATPCRE
jgi:hypothetical protein